MSTDSEQEGATADPTTIVIDCGSFTCRAGFSGDDAPRAVFPPIVGRPKVDASRVGMALKDTYVGDEARGPKPILETKRPGQKWDDMEKIWHHTFYNELRAAPEEHPVLLTEVTLSPREDHNKAAQIMFETFKVPSLCFQDRAVLALMANGYTTGTVIRSGDKVTQIVPIVEMNVQTENVKEMPIAGSHVTDFLCRKLRDRGYSIYTSAEKLTACDIKEKMCYIATNHNGEMTEGGQDSPSEEGGQDSPSEEGGQDSPSEDYTLPDGQKISVGCERFQCPEVFFQPKLIGVEHATLQELVRDSIIASHGDSGSSIVSRIHLAGGSTMFRGFIDRLTHEVRKFLPDDANMKIYGSPDRKYSSWIGGSIFASVSEFSSMFITKDEYVETGPSIFHTKR